MRPIIPTIQVTSHPNIIVRTERKRYCKYCESYCRTVMCSAQHSVVGRHTAASWTTVSCLGLVC